MGSRRRVSGWFSDGSAVSPEGERLGTEALSSTAQDGGEGECPSGENIAASLAGSFCLQGEGAGRKGLHQIMVWLESGPGGAQRKNGKV